MIVFSQQDEQPVVLDYFGDRIGRFVEIGAWDGREFSNCHALALKGWSGVAVEPSPVSFCKLMETYKDNPRVELVNAAVDVNPGIHVFYDSGGDGISTLDQGQLYRWQSTTFHKIWTHRVGVAEFFDTFEGPFDMLSIDAEGQSANILFALPAAVLAGASLVCCEHDGRADEIAAFGREHGLGKVLLVNSENCIIGR